MRFPRFHFGTAIALGLMMLCMSSVPVFADGLFAPTLSANVNGSTVSLSWNVPAGTATFMLRRDTAAAPANTSEGTLVVLTADNTTITYEDAGLASGTYYYSVFAKNGGLTSPPGSAGPLTVSVANSGGGGGVTPQLLELRRQNNLDIWGYPLPVPSSSSSLSSAPISDTDSSASAPVSSASASISSSFSVASSLSSSSTVSPFQQRTCNRAMKWLSGNTVILDTLNTRLMKRYRFMCGR